MEQIKHLFGTPPAGSSFTFDQLGTAATVALAAVLSWLQQRFGALGIMFIITAAAMLLDLLTRIYAAWVSDTEKVESAKIAGGLKKKLGLCLLILTGLLLDIGLEAVTATMGFDLGIDIVFSALIMAWLLIQELISNLENLHEAGIKMPSILMRALQTAADRLTAAEEAAAENSELKTVEKAAAESSELEKEKP